MSAINRIMAALDHLPNESATPERKSIEELLAEFHKAIDPEEHKGLPPDQMKRVAEIKTQLLNLNCSIYPRYLVTMWLLSEILLNE